MHAHVDSIKASCLSLHPSAHLCLGLPAGTPPACVTPPLPQTMPPSFDTWTAACIAECCRTMGGAAARSRSVPPPCGCHVHSCLTPSLVGTPAWRGMQLQCGIWHGGGTGHAATAPTASRHTVCPQVAHEASWRFLLLHGKFTTK